MRIQWLGHACFLLESGGRRLLTDPFDAAVGYPLARVTVDYVTVSHLHHDHNNVKALPGRPRVIDTPGRQVLDGLEINGLQTYHDREKGAKRGPNTVFVLEWEGLRVCHLGDLGHLLSPDQVAAIGTVDVLCIPVGGFYTIDAAEAAETVATLAPAVVLPMHYKTDYTDFPIAPVEDFSKRFAQVERLPALEITAPVKDRGLRVVVLDLAAPGR
ncbi:MAG: MBL fold metallo-hydrolase [Thermoanaerobacterales bacterium]|nr:MBL fold metallo-hydrolase [Bacillota bacterium]MDI6906267.1 MBL fold metallo-hydrolase [Thermoanaerobacterales bacterium]